jgi:hypothetical protein
VDVDALLSSHPCPVLTTLLSLSSLPYQEDGLTKKRAMEVSINALLFLALSSLVQATTTTGNPQPPQSTDLPGLVSQVPSCVAGCLDIIHEGLGCDRADIKCLCSDEPSLVAKMGLCVVAQKCGFEATSSKFTHAYVQLCRSTA